MSRRTGDPLYKTPRWRALRAAVLAEAGYLCERCTAAGRHVAATLVHHVKPIRAGGDPWARTNLTALCSRCHDEVHAELDRAAVAVEDPCRAAWGRYVESLMEAHQ